jgi:hypothetical protein
MQITKHHEEVSQDDFGLMDKVCQWVENSPFFKWQLGIIDAVVLAFVMFLFR